jgi:hypothetical protein
MNTKITRPQYPAEVLTNSCQWAEELRQILRTNPKFKKVSTCFEPTTHECIEIFRDGKWIES